MKKSFLIAAALLISITANSQKNPIDEIFAKYSELEGFTSVYISGRMLNMLGGMESKAGKPDNIMLRLKSIQILTENDSLSKINVNLYQELSRRLDMSIYEELMVVKEGGDITKFLIHQEGEIISELLVVSGGTKGNTLISIRGNINLKELSELSETIGIEELEKLDGVEERKTDK